jgi:hypothetical protein
MTSMVLSADDKQHIRYRRPFIAEGVAKSRYEEIKNAISLLYGEEAACLFAYQVETYSNRMFLRTNVSVDQAIRNCIPEAYREIQAENAAAKAAEALKNQAAADQESTEMRLVA